MKLCHNVTFFLKRNLRHESWKIWHKKLKNFDDTCISVMLNWTHWNIYNQGTNSLNDFFKSQLLLWSGMTLEKITIISYVKISKCQKELWNKLTVTHLTIQLYLAYEMVKYLQISTFLQKSKGTLLDSIFTIFVTIA